MRLKISTYLGHCYLFATLIYKLRMLFIIDVSIEVCIFVEIINSDVC